MALIPQTFIDDLRTRADIVQVVQDYVPLKKAGATWKGLCPFHGEKTPSFQVNPDKGFFYCFGCQTGGDVFKFVELQEKVGFQDAVRLVARRVRDDGAGGERRRRDRQRRARDAAQDPRGGRGVVPAAAGVGGRDARAAAADGARHRPRDDRTARPRLCAAVARRAEGGPRCARDSACRSWRRAASSSSATTARRWTGSAAG